MMTKNNALKAIIEVYQRAAKDYTQILSTISENDFMAIKDSKTKDTDCHSIQTITYHVVASGYTYINYINQNRGLHWLEYKDKVALEDFTFDMAIREINTMLEYNEQSFADFQDTSTKEISSWSYKVRWGVTYNFEQLMEHAIVHILRHKRQIEAFLMM